jgi:hypothetical protein
MQTEPIRPSWNARVVPLRGWNSRVSQRSLWATAVLMRMHMEHANNQVKEELLGRIQYLSRLQPGWDGDGASIPSELAIRNAEYIVKRLPGWLKIEEIDPDAIGGIALWVSLSQTKFKDSRRAWFECRNTGRLLLVLDEGGMSGDIKVHSVENLDPAFSLIVQFFSKDSKSAP